MAQDTSCPTPSPVAGTPLFSEGLRPFFLATALWAVLALGLWAGVLAGAVTPSGAVDPLDWHIHEMLFGFVMAAVAGFLLTAMPNWTGRPSLRGLPLILLLLVWAAARLAALAALLSPLVLPPWPAAVLDAALPLLLAGVAVREVALSRNWRHLPMAVPLLTLAVADLLMMAPSLRAAMPGLGWRLGLAATLILVSVIGGRIIPAFTRNWLNRRGEVRLPAGHGLIDRCALGSLHAGLLAWALVTPGVTPGGGTGGSPWLHGAGALLLLAAAANLWRLARWRGVATGAEPLLAILHVGYLWTAAGAGLLGAAVWGLMPAAAAIHALTAGAIGTMILAVMSRASLGHTGRPLAADRLTVVAYALVNAAALVRIIAGVAGTWTPALLTVSAALWMAAFALFILRYAPVLCRPRLA